MFADKKILLGFLVLMVVGFVSFSQVSYAMDPPTKEQINSYKKDGSYNSRLANARAIENNVVDPSLLNKINKKYIKSSSSNVTSSKINSVSSTGFSGTSSSNFVPTVWKGGLPSTGNVKVPVILIDFPDYPHNTSDTVATADSKFFGNGNPVNYPYESLKNYYLRSSYGKLNISGTVYGWYTAAHLRSYYANLSSSGNFNYGNEALIMEAVKYYDGLGADFSQYDNDNNGYIDGVYIKWTGPDNGWANFWWAYQNSWEANPSFTVDGKKFNKFVWSWYSNSAQGSPSDSIRTDIHETGHLLGLPDYYDYKTGVGPEGGIGGLDMMDSNWGDHNCFSKYILGWISPTIISAGTQKIVLNPSGTSTDAVIIMPGANTNPYQEYFMVQFRKRGTGNDPLNYSGTDSGLGWPGDYPNDGMLIWHVDGTLNSNGTNYLYDNSFTSHKLLKLMEADGLNEIESEAYADGGDYYVPGSVFSQYSNPNSNNYSASDTMVVVDNIAYAGNTIFGRFAVVLNSSVSLNESLDSDLNWTSGGDLNGGKITSWIGEGSVSHDGTDSVQSGFINDDQISWIQTTVQGPGNLSYWWKVSSELNDKLLFIIDDIIVDSIDGIVNWQQKNFKIVGDGTHILKWTYKKDGSGFDGNDTGWLDQVKWVQDDITPPTASANPPGGMFNTTKNVVLSMNESGTIYYTTNGTDPTTLSTKYITPINITTTTTLKYLALDLAGNPSTIYTEYYTIDLVPPTASANPPGGMFNTTKNVVLSMNESGTIYYTTNGTDPTTSSPRYITPINITTTTTLKYLALDLAGNPSTIYTEYYIIDKKSPTVTTTLYSGIYNLNKTVVLKINEKGTIYYTLNGSSPSTKSYRYSGSITISKNTILKYFGVDIAGNISPVYTQNYTINRNVLRITKSTPTNMQTNVPRNAPFKITFSENILPYIHLNNIKVKNIYTGSYLSFNTTIIGNTLHVNAKNKRINTWYMLTIPAKTVKDRAGNYLLVNYTIKFKISS